jgi:hypothetical protein
MSQISIVINVSDQEYVHHNGLSGMYRVSPADGKKFGILLVYDGVEIQDLGEGRFIQRPDWARSIDVAKSIVGFGTDSGPRMKMGLLLCQARPDVPKELERAIEEEREYLNKHKPLTRYTKDDETGAAVLVTAETEGVSAKKTELSLTVQLLRESFEDECRKLVTLNEIKMAHTNLQAEYQRLISQGDQIWAGPENGRINVNELHKRACVALGQQRPWCYVPTQLVDCPGCGIKIQENVLKCPSCNGWLDEGIEALNKMNPKERRVKMYPEQFDREPVSAIKGK